MRSDVDGRGDEIRRNRRKAGATQGDLARHLGVDRTTLGKWDRNEVFPSPRNIRALRKAGMLVPRKGGRAVARAGGRSGLSPALLDEFMTALGCDWAALRVLVSSLEDDAERALVALFRRLSTERQAAVRRIVSAIEVPTDSGAGAESQQDGNGPDR